MDANRKTLARALALAALALAALAAAPADRRSVTFAGRVMGTYDHVVIVTSDSAAAAPLAAIAQGVLVRVDSLMSNWTSTSEVARLNRVAGRAPTVVEPEVARVLATSLDVGRESDGAFDITVEPLVRAWGFLGGRPHMPDSAVVADAVRHVGLRHVQYDAARRRLAFDDPAVRIDLGGIAKGYAVDVAADSLRAHGVTDALVDLTGNMMAMGHSPTGNGWRIGIRDPRDRMPYFAHLELHDEGISTSGKYEQFVAANGRTYGHIMDPRTGRPAEGLLSVTLVSASAFTCDAWDTPLFVLGLDAAKRKARERNDISAIFVSPGTGGVDTVWVESTLRPRFVLEEGAKPLFVVATF